MRFLRIVSVLSISAVILGCSGTKTNSTEAATTPAPSAAPAPATYKTFADPCSLATADEASAVMGRPSKPGELKQAFKGNRCNFYDATSRYEVFIQTVDWNLAAPLMTPENTIHGLGEKAFWSYGSAYVLKNGYGMMIGFQLPDVIPSLTPPARKFAETVVSRM